MVRLPLFLCLLFLFLASSLSAQESYREFERGLNLSESQRAQAWAIKRKYIGAWRALTVASMMRRFELRMLDPARPDQREQAERLQRDLVQIEFARRRLFHQYRREVSSLFTEEQRGRFHRFVEQENRRAMHPVGPFDPPPRRRFYER
jgi:hypothetical protein